MRFTTIITLFIASAALAAPLPAASGLDVVSSEIQPRSTGGFLETAAKFVDTLMTKSVSADAPAGIAAAKQGLTFGDAGVTDEMIQELQKAASGTNKKLAAQATQALKSMQGKLTANTVLASATGQVDPMTKLTPYMKQTVDSLAASGTKATAQAPKSDISKWVGMKSSIDVPSQQDIAKAAGQNTPSSVKIGTHRPAAAST